MDQKTQIMISLAAAIGANCIPCFDHLYAKAKEFDLEDAEIQQAADIAFRVKNGALNFMKQAVEEMTGARDESVHPCCPAVEGCCN